MPPERLAVCRFAAEPPQSPLPYGDWAETLRGEFLAACLRVQAEDVELGDRKSTRLNSSHPVLSRMPSSA